VNFLEIQFQLQGKTLPADHGYAWYSAIKQTFLEDDTDVPSNVLFCSVSGVPDRDGMIYLNRASRFRLRCPSDSEQIRYWYCLQNTVLNIRGHLIRLVQPRLSLPQPSEVLKSRLVTFKLENINHHEVPFYFLESCKKSLEQLEIKAQAFIDSNTEGDLARRALQIKNKKVVGFGVVVEGLSEEDSLKLQCYGLGGRKHFGCGWFYPTKEVLNAT
jgi:CRISPR-associated protein Cas6